MKRSGVSVLPLLMLPLLLGQAHSDLSQVPKGRTRGQRLQQQQCSDLKLQQQLQQRWQQQQQWRQQCQWRQQQQQ